MNIQIIKYPILVALSLVLLGCASTKPVNNGQGTINHLVVFWLKQPGDHATQSELIDVTRTFEQIPGVLSVAAGIALPSNRAVVDDSFDVAISITLQDREALRVYQQHPIHVKAKKEKLKSLVKRFVVYNFIE